MEQENSAVGDPGVSTPGDVLWLMLKLCALRSIRGWELVVHVVLDAHSVLHDNKRSLVATSMLHHALVLETNSSNHHMDQEEEQEEDDNDIVIVTGYYDC